MLLVARRCGGRGLGYRLMEEALGAADCATVFLYATAAGLPLYQKLGFRIVDEIAKHTGVFTPASAPAPGIRIGDTGDLPELVRLDRQAFGADRTMLLRRLLPMADRVVIADEGYALAWRNLGTVQVGPLVANSTSTATALLDAALPEENSTTRVDVCARAGADLSGWLTERGLTAQPPSPLMVYGECLPGNRAMLLAPFTQALG
ncbi:hypothetical protein ACIBCN_26175 [Nocardia sp. NPDC051052]|uniref:hypothetical protein n=1 Tax=Nocardia sp. NPDC051052 TaxID=3364322 RepID=UPI0037B31920